MRVLAAGALLALVGGPAAADEYLVEISKPDLRLARVEATLRPTSDGHLLLSRDADDSGIEGGWAGFMPAGVEVLRDPSASPQAAAHWLAWLLR